MGRRVFPRPPYLTVVALPTYELEPEHKEQWLHAEECYAAKSMECYTAKSMEYYTAKSMEYYAAKSME